jgi:hypothetical protein
MYVLNKNVFEREESHLKKEGKLVGFIHIIPLVYLQNSATPRSQDNQE